MLHHEEGDADPWKRSDTLWSPPLTPIPCLGDAFAAPGHEMTSSNTSGEFAMATQRTSGDSVEGNEGLFISQVATPIDRRRRQLAPQAVMGMRRTSSLGSIPLGVEVDGEGKDRTKSPTEEGKRKSRQQWESNDFSFNRATSIASRRSRRSAICSESVSFASSLTSVTDDAVFSDVADLRSETEERGGGCSHLVVQQGTRDRKKSSVDLGVRYPGDLLSQAPPRFLKQNSLSGALSSKPFHPSTASLSFLEQEKRAKSSFSLKKFMDKKSHRSKEFPSDLNEALQNAKRHEFHDHKLTTLKKSRWTDVVGAKLPHEGLSRCEANRRSAAWELLTSECVFLVDHLFVLKHCFVEPLKQMQVEGFLMFVEVEDLFGNLDELCSISQCFCLRLSRLLLEDIDRGIVCQTETIVEALSQLTEPTRSGKAYEAYCLNYSKAVSYLEKLRKNDEFLEFEKWCEQDPRCNRLLLSDLLIAPLQHCTKLPLLLTSVSRYTENEAQLRLLVKTQQKLETSIRNLDEKMKKLKNFERIQEIQRQIVWPPIAESETRVFIPECLRSVLKRQPCERLLENPVRQLLHESPIQLLEVTTNVVNAVKPVEMHLILFDDILLITKVKKQPKKKAVGGSDNSPYRATSSSTEGVPLLVVHRQPIAVDRFTFHDLTSDASDTPQMSGTCPRNAFAIVQITRFQQIVAIYTFQCPSAESKATWLKKLHECQEEYKKVAVKVTASSPPLANPENSQEIDETNSTSSNRETSTRNAIHASFNRRHHQHRRFYCNHRRKSYDRICIKNPRRWHRKISRTDSEVRLTDRNSFDERTDQPGSFESGLEFENDDCSPTTEYTKNGVERYQRTDILANSIKEVDGDYEDNEKAQLDETGPRSEVRIGRTDMEKHAYCTMTETIFI